MNRVILATLTGATCGAGCWEAREEVCRCSCGGKNHGIALDPNNPTPQRTAKIDGRMYRLEAVGKYNEINKLGHNFALTLGWKTIKYDMLVPSTGRPYHYGYYPNDTGSPVLVKTAAAHQREWPEVKRMEIPSPMTPYILWVLEDLPDPKWCETLCIDCDKRKFEILMNQTDEPATDSWDI